MDWSQVKFPCRVRCLDAAGFPEYLRTGETYQAFGFHAPGEMFDEAPRLKVIGYTGAEQRFYAGRFELAHDDGARAEQYSADPLSGVF